MLKLYSHRNYICIRVMIEQVVNNTGRKRLAVRSQAEY